MSSRWVHAPARSALQVSALARSAFSVCAGLLALGCGQAAAPSSEVNGAAAPSDTPSSDTPSEAAAPAGKRAPCTLGADQTCNDDERVSALWGRCTELGVCECVPGFVLNPRGRCQPPAP